MARTIREVAEAFVFAARLKRTPARIKGYDTEQVGHVIVEMETDDGTLFNRPAKMQATVPLDPGMPVLLGLDYRRDLAVLDADFDGQVEAGVNPLINNPADHVIYGTTNQGSIQTFKCFAVGTEDTPSTLVTVLPWQYRWQGQWYMSSKETALDLDSFIPTDPDTHCLVVVWLIKATNTLEVTASTPKNLLEQFDEVDIQECQDAATATSEPATVFRLYEGQVNVTADDEWRDIRQIINVADESSGGGAPTDAKYWVSEAHADLSAETNLGALTSGLLKQTVAGSVATPAIATPGVDYLTGDAASYEVIQDMIFTFLAEGANIDLTYDDPSNTLAVAVPSLNNAPVGAVTPSTGAFTDLSATTFIDLTEASTPSTPASDHARVWAVDNNGFTELDFFNSTAQVREFFRDNIIVVKNLSGGTLNAVTPVQFSSSGGFLGVSKADADFGNEALLGFGVTMESAANNAFLHVMLTGILSNIDTSAWAANSILYLGTTLGTFTPTAPALGSSWKQAIARVIVSDATVGVLHIMPAFRYLTHLFADVIGIGMGGAASLEFYGTATRKGALTFAALTSDQIATFIDATGNVVLDSATQTLTNKSISGAQIDSGTVAAARLGTMTGATSSGAGASGASPQPAAGDDTKVLSGAATYVRGLVNLFSNGADVTIASSAAETTLIGSGLGSPTLPANLLNEVGRTFAIHAIGYASRTTGNTTIKIKVGGTTIFTLGPLALTWGTNNRFEIYAVFTTKATGASGTIKGQGHVDNSGSITTFTRNFLVQTGTTTLDLTGTLAVDVTWQWSTSGAAQTVTCTTLTITQLAA